MEDEDGAEQYKDMCTITSLSFVSLWQKFFAWIIEQKLLAIEY